MNRADLVAHVHDSMYKELNKRQIEDVINTAFNIISYNVAKGDDVRILGFGTFVKTKRKARLRRNPQTGESIKIASYWAPKFKAHEALKNLIREGGIL